MSSTTPTSRPCGTEVLSNADVCPSGAPPCNCLRRRPLVKKQEELVLQAWDVHVDDPTEMRYESQVVY